MVRAKMLEKAARRHLDGENVASTRPAWRQL
jgi:hypothetical protein